MPVLNISPPGGMPILLHAMFSWTALEIVFRASL
jgi:hypothetical protein